MKPPPPPLPLVAIATCFVRASPLSHASPLPHLLPPPPQPLSTIVDRICFGAFYQSGQSCIHLQRLLVRQDHYDAVVSALVEKTKLLKKGNPLQPDTFVGPLIFREATPCASRGG